MSKTKLQIQAKRDAELRRLAKRIVKRLCGSALGMAPAYCDSNSPYGFIVAVAEMEQLIFAHLRRAELDRMRKGLTT